MPEGGHLVANTPNNVGVLIKTQDGLGLANATCILLDDIGSTTRKFKLNAFGIGNFNITSDQDRTYQVKIETGTQEKEHILDSAEPKGITMQVNCAGAACS